jgi:hypothetical protein
MAIGDECTLRIVGRFQGQNIVNTMHYKILEQSSSELDILDQLCGAWENTHKSLWRSNHNQHYTLVGLKAFRKTGVAKTPAAKSIGQDGTVAEEPASSFIGRTITLYVAGPDNARRGRLMLSGTSSTELDPDDGSLLTAAITAITALGVQLIQALVGVGDTWEPGLPSEGEKPWAGFVDAQGRETPSIIRSRRIREFFVG